MGAVLGLLIGSFLNVVIARVPAGESLVRPGSRCPACETPIAARDNVPVLSWLLLRGRARCCATPISARYPIVETLTALAFGLVTWWVATRSGAASWPLAGHGLPHLAAVLALVAMLYLAAASVALAAIDIDTRRLPFWIVAPSSGVMLVLLGGSVLAAGAPRTALRMLIGAAALWAVYRLLHLIYPPGMGYGDVRLSFLIGLCLGWLGWGPLLVGAFAGFVLGALGGVLLGALGGGLRKRTIPFGPYMLAGLWLGLTLGESLMQWYRNLTGV